MRREDISLVAVIVGMLLMGLGRIGMGDTTSTEDLGYFYPTVLIVGFFTFIIALYFLLKSTLGPLDNVKSGTKAKVGVVPKTFMVLGVILLGVGYVGNIVSTSSLEMVAPWTLYLAFGAGIGTFGWFIHIGIGVWNDRKPVWKRAEKI